MVLPLVRLTVGSDTTGMAVAIVLPVVLVSVAIEGKLLREVMELPAALMVMDRVDWSVLSRGCNWRSCWGGWGLACRGLMGTFGAMCLVLGFTSTICC